MVSAYPSDSEIAKSVELQPISEVAKSMGIHDSFEPYGRLKAKINTDKLPKAKRQGKLILVTAINPTPAGEGKTTTTIGLADGLRSLGKKASICLREPSLGPFFGVKGGATGGGRAQVGPSDDINLHFTGDFHAITSANNLVAAMIDNHLHWGNKLDFNESKVVWRRVMDMNDRCLRLIETGLGGQVNGVQRHSGFDITVASEIMAIFCLARDMDDFEKRFNNIVIGYNNKGRMIRAGELGISRAVVLLLKDAINPNLVQSLEGTPALIHGGPFANIAHGCNSYIATKTAMETSDYVVTEAGFGADLGAEKFFHIKCRSTGLQPGAVVVVATIRALKMHGGVDKGSLAQADEDALQKGLANLGRHLDNLALFGIPVVVALNYFLSDSENEIALVQQYTQERGIKTFLAKHWEQGSKGIVELAAEVVELCEQPSKLKYLYDEQDSLIEKISKIATSLYGAEKVEADKSILERLSTWEDVGFGNLPVCMAKTPFSFSADPKLMGAPTGHSLPLREVRLSAGAGFVVALCGKVMTMPGLPKITAAETM